MCFGRQGAVLMLLVLCMGTFFTQTPVSMSQQNSSRMGRPVDIGVCKPFFPIGWTHDGQFAYYTEQNVEVHDDERGPGTSGQISMVNLSGLDSIGKSVGSFLFDFLNENEEFFAESALYRRLTEVVVEYEIVPLGLGHFTSGNVWEPSRLGLEVAERVSFQVVEGASDFKVVAQNSKGQVVWVRSGVLHWSDFLDLYWGVPTIVGVLESPLTDHVALLCEVRGEPVEGGNFEDDCHLIFYSLQVP